MKKKELTHCKDIMRLSRKNANCRIIWESSVSCKNLFELDILQKL